jgi:hypothetical protein
MKFHEYRTLWQEMRSELPQQATEEHFYAVAMAGGLRTGNGLVLAEGAWKQQRRPYYNVWPAIVPALLKLRLDIPSSLIRTPLPVLVVRLPADKTIEELPGVQTALIQQDETDGDLRMWVNFMRPTGLANMPHYRRPHPALVWTGHGRAVPRIVMRKGTVVHREMLARVPTGFDGQPERDQTGRETMGDTA